MPCLRFRSAGPMTLNNYTNEEMEHLRNVDTMNGKIKYITFIQEIGQEGTPHLQIYAQANEKLSIKAWHEILGPRVANIVATQDQDKAIKYCQGLQWNKETQEYEVKPGSNLESVFEKGTLPQAGRRNDIHNAVEAVTQLGLHDMMITNNEHLHTIASHYTFFKDVDQKVVQHDKREIAKKNHYTYMSTRITEPWEQVLYETVEQHKENPDHRTIHWFHDHIGESGKTVNAKQLVFEHNAFYTTGGKANDIYHAYNLEPIVILNICASQNQECTDHLYKILEEFKDGIFTSGKYGSTTKIFDSPLVIVFSNYPPDETKMKKNRLLIHDIVKLNNPSMETEDTTMQTHPFFTTSPELFRDTRPAGGPMKNKRKFTEIPYDRLKQIQKKASELMLKKQQDEFNNQ